MRASGQRQHPFRPADFEEVLDLDRDLELHIYDAHGAYEIVGRAEAKGLLDVIHRGAVDQDRDLAEGHVRCGLLDEFEAVLRGDVEVEQYEVHLPLAQDLQRLLPTLGVDKGVVFGVEDALEERPVVRVVIDAEDVGVTFGQAARQVHRGRYSISDGNRRLQILVQFLEILQDTVVHQLLHRRAVILDASFWHGRSKRPAFLLVIQADRREQGIDRVRHVVVLDGLCPDGLILVRGPLFGAVFPVQGGLIFEGLIPGHGRQLCLLFSSIRLIPSTGRFVTLLPVEDHLRAFRERLKGLICLCGPLLPRPSGMDEAGGARCHEGDHPREFAILLRLRVGFFVFALLKRGEKRRQVLLLRGRGLSLLPGLQQHVEGQSFPCLIRGGLFSVGVVIFVPVRRLLILALPTALFRHVPSPRFQIS